MGAAGLETSDGLAAAFWEVFSDVDGSVDGLGAGEAMKRTGGGFGIVRKCVIAESTVWPVSV